MVSNLGKTFDKLIQRYVYSILSNQLLETNGYGEIVQ